MGKKSSHYYCSLYCNLNYMIIMKHICFVIIIMESCKVRGALAVTAVEQTATEHNYSVASVPFEINDESTSRAAATPTADFDVQNVNVVDGAPLNGWQCHCWNSTNGLEVCTRVVPSLSLSFAFVFFIKHRWKHITLSHSGPTLDAAQKKQRNIATT